MKYCFICGFVLFDFDVLCCLGGVDGWLGGSIELREFESGFNGGVVLCDFLNLFEFVIIWGDWRWFMVGFLEFWLSLLLVIVDVGVVIGFLFCFVCLYCMFSSDVLSIVYFFVSVLYCFWRLVFFVCVVVRVFLYVVIIFLDDVCCLIWSVLFSLDFRLLILVW